MSVEVISWVLNHSPSQGTDKVVLIGLANHADPAGCNAWPSIATLERYARVDRRTVRRSLQRLEEAGAIVVERNAGGVHDTPADRRPNRYRIVMSGGTPVPPRSSDRGDASAPSGGTPASQRGDASVPGGGTPVPPEPSLEPSTNRPVPSPLPPAQVRGIENSAEAVRLVLWPLWPSGRKVGIPATRRALAAALRSGADPDAIVEGARRDSQVWATWTRQDLTFVPHPATWVNDRRWESDPPLPRQARRSRRDEQVDDLSGLAEEAAALPSFDDLLRPNTQHQLDDPGSLGA